MKHQITYRNSCRLCGSENVRKFLHFDDIPFADEFLTVDKIGTEFLAPLDVYWCGNCNSVQTLHNVSIESYYETYHYEPSKSAFVRNFMEILVQKSLDKFGLKPGDSVIEIGSADGYQLACFQDKGLRVLGFEPATELVKTSQERNVDVVHGLFTSESVPLIPQDMLPLQLVTLGNTFDHLLDPVAFLRTIRDLMDPKRGVLLIEVHDLKKIVDRRETILFEHEHTTFLHLYSMKSLLEREGFTLLAANFIPDEQMRGNSLLVAAGVQGCDHVSDDLPPYEDFAYLDAWETFTALEQKVHDSYRGLKAYIAEQKQNNRTLAGYGAMGRGVMTSAMARLDSDDLEYICDHNPYFHGLYTPGSNIIVSPPDRLMMEPVDEVIVFAYGYMSEIKVTLADYLAAGGKLTSFLELI